MYKIKRFSKCPEGKCIHKTGDHWSIYSGRDGHKWSQKYKSKESAENALKAYHASK